MAFIFSMMEDELGIEIPQAAREAAEDRISAELIANAVHRPALSICLVLMLFVLQNRRYTNYQVVESFFECFNTVEGRSILNDSMVSIDSYDLVNESVNESIHQQHNVCHCR